MQNSPNPSALQNWLAQQHYTQWTSYEPASRFWHFQVIEAGWLVALSAILIAASVWLVRRRAADTVLRRKIYLTERAVVYRPVHGWRLATCCNRADTQS